MVSSAKRSESKRYCGEGLVVAMAVILALMIKTFLYEESEFE